MWWVMSMRIVSTYYDLQIQPVTVSMPHFEIGSR